MMRKEVPPIFEAIWAKMGRNGERPTDVAKFLDITYPYLMALARNERSISGLPKEKLRKIAEYLDVPVGQVFLLAKILQPTDFDVDKDGKLLEGTRVAMLGDPFWRGFAPTEKEWKRLPKHVQAFIAMLYEAWRTGKYDPLKTPEEAKELTV
jgi:transcriptional regulator with XRE-family HTH domain